MAGLSPLLPPSARKTYRILAPAATHWRPATCAEMDCPHYLHGWRTKVDETTDLGKAQAYYIRTQSGRKFTAVWDGGLTVFTFEAGQQCFAQHRTRIDRPEIFVVRDGDHRGNPRGTPTYVHKSADDWVDDFANHQLALAERMRQG